MTCLVVVNNGDLTAYALASKIEFERVAFALAETKFDAVLVLDDVAFVKK